MCFLLFSISVQIRAFRGDAAYSDGLWKRLNKTAEHCTCACAWVAVMWLLFIWCEKWFKVNEMESVSQSITGTGVVYFPPTHHLLHLALAMILSVLLSRTLTQQWVSARLISPGGRCAHACARPLLFALARRVLCRSVYLFSFGCQLVFGSTVGKINLCLAELRSQTWWCFTSFYIPSTPGINFWRGNHCSIKQ